MSLSHTILLNRCIKQLFFNQEKVDMTTKLFSECSYAIIDRRGRSLSLSLYYDRLSRATRWSLLPRYRLIGVPLLMCNNTPLCIIAWQPLRPFHVSVIQYEWSYPAWPANNLAFSSFFLISYYYYCIIEDILRWILIKSLDRRMPRPRPIVPWFNNIKRELLRPLETRPETRDGVYARRGAKFWGMGSRRPSAAWCEMRSRISEPRNSGLHCFKLLSLNHFLALDK